MSFAGGTGYGGATARACDAYPRVESEHVVLPTLHQRARITPDVGEARITAAAPYKAAITPSGSLSGAGLRDLPGPTSLSYGCNQQYDKYRVGLNQPYSIWCHRRRKRPRKHTNQAVFTPNLLRSLGVYGKKIHSKFEQSFVHKTSSNNSIT